MGVMKALNFIVFEILSNQTIFLGLIALLGLLLQRKKLPQVIDGVVKTVIGITVLGAGAGLLINSLSPVVQELNKSLHVKGVLPTNDAVFGVVLKFDEIARNAVVIFLLAFFLHLLLVRLTPGKDFKNVYLTAHLMLYHAAFMAVTLPVVLHAKALGTIVVGTLLNALYYTYSPAITRRLARKWTHDQITLGFMDQVGSILAHFIGKWVGNADPDQDADKLKLPKWASMFRDSTIVLFS